VIIRLMGEGQWRVDDSVLARLDELDQATEAAVAAGDEAKLHATLAALAAAVRTAGERLPDEDLSASDLIVPPVDLSLDEARELLHGEGLIPDLP
jgi:hypothetical protein